MTDFISVAARPHAGREERGDEKMFSIFASDRDSPIIRDARVLRSGWAFPDREQIPAGCRVLQSEHGWAIVKVPNDDWSVVDSVRPPYPPAPEPAGDVVLIVSEEVTGGYHTVDTVCSSGLAGRGRLYLPGRGQYPHDAVLRDGEPLEEGALRARSDNFYSRGKPTRCVHVRAADNRPTLLVYDEERIAECQRLDRNV